jgi:hypothetical protein
MNITSKHRIRVVIKAETEIITSITVSSIKQAVILVIMYVKTLYIFMVDVAGFTFVIHIGWLVVYVPRLRKAERGIWKCWTSVC